MLSCWIVPCWASCPILRVDISSHACSLPDPQVLPLRTHPTMNMNHGGGYILSATVLAQQ